MLKKSNKFLFQQPFESLHANFKATWARYKRKMGNPDYMAKLLDAVVAFNSMNI